MDRKFDVEALFQQLLALVRDRAGVWASLSTHEGDLDTIFWPWVFVLGAVQGFFVFLGLLFVPLWPFSVALYSGLFGTLIKTVGMVFVCGWMANLMAEKFNGQPDIKQAMGLVALAYTPVAAVALLMIFVRFSGVFAWLNWVLGVAGFAFLVYDGCATVLGIEETDMPKRVLFTVGSISPFLVTAMPMALIAI